MPFQKYYDVEVECYKQLQELQGKCIPWLFATLQYEEDTTSSPFDLPELPKKCEIPAVVLEYIEGATPTDKVRLKDGESIWKLQHRCARRARQALVCFWEMAVVGVGYNDIHGGNLPFTEDRVFLIDFGHTALRGTATSDEHWDSITSSRSWEMEKNLHELLLRELPPSPMEWFVGNGWSLAKRTYSQTRTDRRVEKALGRVVLHDRSFIPQYSFVGNMDEPRFFDSKPEIEEQLAHSELNRHDFTKPRPGSPSEAVSDLNKAPNLGIHISSGESGSEGNTPSFEMASSAIRRALFPL